METLPEAPATASTSRASPACSPPGFGGARSRRRRRPQLQDHLAGTDEAQLAAHRPLHGRRVALESLGFARQALVLPRNLGVLGLKGAHLVLQLEVAAPATGIGDRRG